MKDEIEHGAKRAKQKITMLLIANMAEIENCFFSS